MPFIDPGGHRDGGDNDRQRNQRRFRRQVRNIKQHAQAVVELHHNPERGGDTEDGADHRRDIDAVADRPLIFLPKIGYSAERMVRGKL
jgi:hypothetical protein